MASFLPSFVISPLSAQIKAPLFEKWLGAKLNAKKISPSLNRGDFKDKNGKYFELKQSFSNDANTLNMRQIRLWQNIDYYLVIYSDELAPENSIFLNIPKDKMILECKNASATHGTISANKSNSNIELSMSLKINSDKIKLWISQYGDKEINYENIK